MIYIPDKRPIVERITFQIELLNIHKHKIEENCHISFFTHHQY